VVPASQDITIYQGDTWDDLFFRVRNRVYNSSTGEYEAGSYVDLTGYTAKAEIRPTPGGNLIVAMTVTLSNQSTTPGGVLLSLTPTQTAGLPTSGGVYDVQLTSGAGVKRTYLAGKVTVIPEVTTG
jgi:hypothetical protein